MIRHAGLVAAFGRSGWRGVLIEGASGAGKSDLALRALGDGFRLVADDRVEVWASGGRLFGQAPETLRGLIEARGLGVLDAGALAFAEVALVVRCGTPERLPDAETAAILGLALPQLTLNPFEASAPAKLRRALHAFDAGFKRRI